MGLHIMGNSASKGGLFWPVKHRDGNSTIVARTQSNGLFRSWMKIFEVEWLDRTNSTIRGSPPPHCWPIAIRQQCDHMKACQLP